MSFSLIKLSSVVFSFLTLCMNCCLKFARFCMSGAWWQLLDFLNTCWRSWLREAQLGVTAADEAAPLLENPLRNGTLLCDLAGSLFCCFFEPRTSIVWSQHSIVMSRNKCMLAYTRSVQVWCSLPAGCDKALQPAVAALALACLA